VNPKHTRCGRANRLPQGAQGAMRAKGAHAITKNEANEANTMPRAQNAKKPMNNDNALFADCVIFTHHA